jgi:hypothetical protein
MTANDSTPSDGESPAESTVDHLAANVEDLDAEERDLLAERLEVLANRVHAELLGLAADVEGGEDPTESDVEDARTHLRRADETVRRHLGGVTERDLSEVERDPREPAAHMVDFREEYDLDYLRDAPVEEVAHKLAADVMETREVADRVDRHLYAGELTDVDVEDLWDCGLRLRGWGANVLAFRTDRDLKLTREEAEALDRAEEKLADGEEGR